MVWITPSSDWLLQTEVSLGSQASKLAYLMPWFHSRCLFLETEQIQVLIAKFSTQTHVLLLELVDGALELPLRLQELLDLAIQPIQLRLCHLLTVFRFLELYV